MGNRTRLALLLLLSSLAAIGCLKTVSPSQRPLTADAPTVSQDPAAYVRKADRSLLPPEETAETADILVYDHFAPWDRQAASQSRETAFRALYAFAEKHPDQGGPLLALADPDAYPRRKEPGVVLSTSPFRPQPGEKVPEGLQNGLGCAWRGLPVFISHQSRDGRFVLVESRLGCAWLATTEVATVSQSFMQHFRKRHLAAVMAEGTALTEGGHILETGHVGMLLPLVSDQGGHPAVNLPVVRSDGSTGITVVKADQGGLRQVPVPATPRLAAEFAQTLLAPRPGQVGAGVCVQSLPDVFAPLGVSLPPEARLSAKVGHRLDISSLKPAERIKTMRIKAEPFVTLALAGDEAFIVLGADGEKLALLRPGKGAQPGVVAAVTEQGTETLHLVPAAKIDTLAFLVTTEEGVDCEVSE